MSDGAQVLESIYDKTDFILKVLCYLFKGSFKNLGVAFSILGFKCS